MAKHWFPTLESNSDAGHQIQAPHDPAQIIASVFVSIDLVVKKTCNHQHMTTSTGTVVYYNNPKS